MPVICEQTNKHFHRTKVWELIFEVCIAIEAHSGIQWFHQNGPQSVFGIEKGIFLRPHSHRTLSTSQNAHANYGTHCSQWECSHRLQATSKGLHANLCANLFRRPVWTGPNLTHLTPHTGTKWIKQKFVMKVFLIIQNKTSYDHHKILN